MSDKRRLIYIDPIHQAEDELALAKERIRILVDSLEAIGTLITKDSDKHPRLFDEAMKVMNTTIDKLKEL